MYTLKAKLKTDFWFWKLHKDLGTLGEGLNPKKKKKCEFSHKGGCTNLGHFHTQMSLSPSVCLSAKPLYSLKSSSFIIQHSSCNSRLMHSFFWDPCRDHCLQTAFFFWRGMVIWSFLDSHVPFLYSKTPDSCRSCQNTHYLNLTQKRSLLFFTL